MTGASADQWTSHGVPNSVLSPKPFAPAQLVTAVPQLSMPPYRGHKDIPPFLFFDGPGDTPLPRCSHDLPTNQWQTPTASPKTPTQGHPCRHRKFARPPSSTSSSRPRPSSWAKPSSSRMEKPAPWNTSGSTKCTVCESPSVVTMESGRSRPSSSHSPADVGTDHSSSGSGVKAPPLRHVRSTLRSRHRQATPCQ
jgi:hypothetical protein